MRVLVTGASGFVGSAIVRFCHDAGLEVRATGRSARPRYTGPDHVSADLTDTAVLPKLVADCDCVVHAAGLAHQFDRKPSRAAFVEINATATAHLMKAAVGAGVRHVVLISSVSVYGSHTSRSCTEEARCEPHEPYAVSKYLAEQEAQRIADEAGMSLTILRLATVYGEEDPGNVGRLIRTIDRGRFVWIGTGTNLKSLTHRDDVGRACVIALQHAGRGTDIFNVTGLPCTMQDIVSQLALCLNRKLPRWHVPGGLALRLTGSLARLTGEGSRAGRLHTAVRKWLADDAYDGSKFERTFGFRPQVSVEEGLRREVAWYHQQLG